MERGDDAQSRALRREIRAQHPRFLDAVLEDAKVTASYRAERHEVRSRVDAIGQALRRAWVMSMIIGRLRARWGSLGTTNRQHPLVRRGLNNPPVVSVAVVNHPGTGRGAMQVEVVEDEFVARLEDRPHPRGRRDLLDHQ